MFPLPNLVSLILASSFAAIVLATPARYHFTLVQPALVRGATWSDVNAKYDLVYNVSSGCPSTIQFGVPLVDSNQVGSLPMSSISEDTFACAGPNSLILVPEAVVRDPNGLSNLNLNDFQAGLDANSIAKSLSSHQLSTEMIIGWHASFRACGESVYEQNTFYFFIREQTGFRLSFEPSPDMRDVVFIPPNMRSLCIIPTNGQICLFVDTLSAPGSNVTLTRSNDSGESETTVINPVNAPTSSPSASPLPRRSDSSISPSVAQIPPPVPDVSPGESGSVVPSPSAQPYGSPLPSYSVNPPTSTPFMTEDAGNQNPETVNSPGFFIQPSPSPPDVSTQPTATAEPDGNALCFPASAMVRMASGIEMRMSDLNVGDTVMTPDGLSKVIFFTHRLHGVHHSFVRIATERTSIMMTGGHYVVVWGHGLRRACDVKVGDWLLFGKNGRPVVVKGINTVCAKGVYNPQTSNGLIIVNGIVTSTYTTAVHAVLAHGPLMSLIRAVFSVSSRAAGIVSGLFDSGAPWISSLLPRGPANIPLTYMHGTATGSVG